MGSSGEAGPLREGSPFMSEETENKPGPDDFEYHPAIQRLSSQKTTSQASVTVKFITYTVAVTALIGGWLYLVYREPPKPPRAPALGAAGDYSVQTPAPFEVLNNPEFQAALLLNEEQIELDIIARRFVEVEGFQWKKVGWRVEKIRDIDEGIALGKDVEAFQDITGVVMETRITEEDVNGLWDIGIQYAMLLGVTEDDPDFEQKIALVAAYVNNENLLIEYEKFVKKEYNPHLVPPGSLVRFRPLNDSRLEALFTDWHQVIDREG